MQAIQTFRTRREHINLSDFELLVMALSALKWQQHNGRIVLHTDSVGLSYLDEHGLIAAWNNVSTMLDGMRTLSIDENVFWAGSKLYALSHSQVPCVIMDLDFILWRPVDFSQYGRDIAVIHLEDIYEPVYPSKERFLFTDDWKLPSWLDWTVCPANGALVYYGSQRFLQDYTSFALEFMLHTADHSDRLFYMVFVEQRWLSMCAKKLGIAIHPISTLENLFAKQKYFTHVWGYKQALRDNPEVAKKFCCDCASRLMDDFPDFAENIAQKDWAARYFS